VGIPSSCLGIASNERFKAKVVLLIGSFDGNQQENVMKTYTLFAMILIGTMVTGVQAGELKKEYFAATPPGAWAQYILEAGDGSKYLSSSQRNADEDGRVVVEESMKGQAGAGTGTESQNVYLFQKDFKIAHDWLSFGKFTEKMTMKAGGAEIPIDATTLDTIKKASKDFRGSVTFEAMEKIDGRNCDRYVYSVTTAGPAPGKETGRLWLDPTVPFGIVRQTAKSYNADGSAASSFDMRLQDTGLVRIDSPDTVSPPGPVAPPTPMVASLIDGYKAGRIGIEVSVEKGMGGRRLQLVFINKTESDQTVTLQAGKLDIPASEPVEKLQIVVKDAADIVVPATASSDTITVEQQLGWGATDGKFELSVYEDTLLFTGSITLGTVK
jgi:hypothetical protein